MAGYFLDSSAVVKRYVLENGSAWVRSLTQPAAVHDLYLARITGVEVVAALLRHQPSLPAGNLASALAHFQRDFRKCFHIVSVDRQLVTQAMLLAIKHRLRGHDSVQLAAALAARSLASALAPVFVSADDELNRAAGVEGFTVDNPNAHP